MKKRLFSFLLALVMVLSLLPATAMAATLTPAQQSRKVTIITKDANGNNIANVPVYLIYRDTKDTDTVLATLTTGTDGTVSVTGADLEALATVAGSGYLRADVATDQGASWDTAGKTDARTVTINQNSSGAKATTGNNPSVELGFENTWEGTYDWDNTAFDVTFTLEYVSTTGGSTGGETGGETGAKTGKINFEVYEAGTTTPISGVQIELVSYTNTNGTENKQTYGAVTTGADGKASIERSTIEAKGTLTTAMIFDCNPAEGSKFDFKDPSAANIVRSIDFGTATNVVNGNTGNPQNVAKITEAGINGNFEFTFKLYLTFKGETYTVNYAAGTTDDTVTDMPTTQSKRETVALTLSSAVPSRTGYTFDGWKDASGNEYSAGATYSADANATLTAQWKANTYTIKFNNGAGASTTDSIDATYGVAATAPAAPTWDGHTFKGWTYGGTTYAAGAELKNLTTEKEGVVELVAQWDTDTYTVAYDAGEYGTGTIAADTKTHGVDLTLSSDTFTRTGYHQTGWATEENGEQAYALGATYSENKAVTLYPVWKANEYTIEFSNGTGASTTDSIDATYGVAATAPAAPTWDGHTFKGWTYGSTTYQAGATLKNLTDVNGATVTLTAQWNDIYTVTFNSNGGSSVAAQQVENGEKATKPTNPTRDGFTFQHWMLNDAEYSFDTPVTGNITLIAKWSQNTYAQRKLVIRTVGPDGTTPVANVPVTVYVNTNVTGTIDDHEAIYNTLTGADGTVTITADTMDALKNVTNGQFIYASVNGGAFVWDLTTTARTVETDSTMTNNKSEAFTHGTNSDGYLKVTVNSEYEGFSGIFTLKGVSPATYTVTYAPGTDGTGTEQTATKNYDVPLTLKGATFTREGYDQTGWATTDGGTKAYELGESYTANASITLYPVWTLKTYTVTYKPGALGTGADRTDTKTHGVDLTLSSTPFTNDNYYQIGWATTEDGEQVYGLYENNTYTDNAPLTLYPVWAPNGYTVTYMPEEGCSDPSQIYTDTKYYNIDLTLRDAIYELEGFTQTGWVEVQTDEAPPTEVVPDAAVAYTASTPTTYSLKGIYTKNDAATLCPVWTANTYTIAFDNGEGASTTDSISATYGETYIAPTAPTRDGYTFQYWTYNGNQYKPGDTLKNLTSGGGTVTLKAAWNHVCKDDDGNGRCDICDICLHGAPPAGAEYCNVVGCDHRPDCMCHPDPTRGVREITVKTVLANGTAAANVPVQLWVNPNNGDAHYTVGDVLRTGTDGKVTFTGDNTPALKDLPYGVTLYCSVAANTDGWDFETTNPVRTVAQYAPWMYHADRVVGSDKNEYAWLTATSTMGFTVNFTCKVRQTTVTPDPVYYTVTFDSAGGSAVTAQSVQSGAKATEPADPTRSGYTFLHWTLNGTEYDFDNAVTESITLTAQWSKNTPDPVYYTVTFNSNGGSAVTAQNVKSGDKATKPADPTRSGYTFQYWTLNGTEYDFDSTVTGSITLTAQWSKNTPDPVYYTVTFDSNGGSAVTAQNVLSGAKATEPADPTRSGYTFLYWTLNGTEYDFDSAVTGSITLIAQWSKNPVTCVVRYTDGVAGEVVFRDQVYTVNRGDRTPSFRGTPEREGYIFLGWEPEVATFVTASVVYTAQWYDLDGLYTPAATVKVNGLNTTDHLCYIVGRGDGTVDPEGTITRAEAATIFFRLMDDDYRTANWSTSASYADVADGAWYSVAVATLERAGAIRDTATGGNFRPNDPITRAELAVMAAQFAKVSGGSIPAASFTDVGRNHWAAKEIALVEYAGWIKGFAGYYRPEDNLTRAEVMAVINRMLQRGTEVENMLPGMPAFTDLRPNEWYYETVLEATCSHTYIRTGALLTGENFRGEKWTGLLDYPDWAAMEQAWAQAAQK